jgi:hypothetical protein
MARARTYADLKFAARRMNWNIIDEVRRDIRGQLVQVPYWVQVLTFCPPPQILLADRPGQIVYPEDSLRRKWMARHPEAAKIRWKSKYVGQHHYWQHPATNFVERQLRLMRKGYEEDEAYEIVEEEDRQAQRLRDLESWLAIEQLDDKLTEEIIESAKQEIGDVPPQEPPITEISPDIELLQHIIDELKMRGIVTPLDPELLPKGIDLSELLVFLKERPENQHYFNIPLLVAYFSNEGTYPLVAEALSYIYGADKDEAQKIKAQFDSFVPELEYTAEEEELDRAFLREAEGKEEDEEEQEGKEEGEELSATDAQGDKDEDEERMVDLEDEDEGEEEEELEEDEEDEDEDEDEEDQEMEGYADEDEKNEEDEDLFMDEKDEENEEEEDDRKKAKGGEAHHPHQPQTRQLRQHDAGEGVQSPVSDIGGTGEAAAAGAQEGGAGEGSGPEAGGETGAGGQSGSPEAGAPAYPQDPGIERLIEDLKKNMDDSALDTPYDDAVESLNEIIDMYFDGEPLTEEEEQVMQSITGDGKQGEAERANVELEMIKLQRMLYRLRRLPRVAELDIARTPPWRMLVNILTLRPRQPMTAEELAEAKAKLAAVKQQRDEEERKQYEQQRVKLASRPQFTRKQQSKNSQSQSTSTKESPIIK